MKTQLRLLHLEDSPHDAELIHSMLESEGLHCDLVHVNKRPDFERAVAEGGFDLVLSDFALPDYDGLSALALVRKVRPQVPFILVSGTVGEDGAIDSLKSGATDYVLKTRLVRLAPAVRRALNEAETLNQRKHAEELLRDQAALLDKARDAICVNDLSQNILYWNKGAERLYDWTSAEAVGRNANDLLFHGDTVQSLRALRDLIRRDEWQGELHKVDRRGRELIVESRWTLMRDESGQPKSILVIDTDVTEKKEAEAKFLRTQRMEGIGALAGGIAHDLNNALAPILMAADMLKSEIASERGMKMLEAMKSGARRGSEMVKQILSFARGVSGEHAVLQPKHLITDIVMLVRSTFPASIAVKQKIAKDLGQIRGDATQLHQVLLNLCVNARDAMPEGGTLLIEAGNIEIDETYVKRQSLGPHIVLTVTDTGQGIPPETLVKIFEPFFTTKEPGKGTGLGLSTVMGIVKTHGGFVDVTSHVGHGTTFHVFLPATAEVEENGEQKQPDLPSGAGELILLVDDDLAILEITKLNLEAHDYLVMTANNGSEAIMLYEQHQNEIKAVITDMQMPVMNGLELILRLRKINPAVKLIGISGEGSGGDLSKAAQPLVQAFMTKPYTTEKLLVKLRQILAV